MKYSFLTPSFLAFFVGTAALAAEGSGDRLGSVIGVLKQSGSGRVLLERARDTWELDRSEELIAHLEWGEVSRTDAILTRHYDPKQGREFREREVTIVLRRDQDLMDTVLDLAHELVHATHSPSWDPYDPNLTLAGYIKAAIEGPGGEVDALLAECRVAFDLESRYSVSLERCKKYFKANRIERKAIQSDFYRVGEWKSRLVRVLGQAVKNFPDLSDEEPELYSSTGNAPYPVSLLNEYIQMSEVACENTRKRSQLKNRQKRRSGGNAPELVKWTDRRTYQGTYRGAYQRSGQRSKSVGSSAGRAPASEFLRKRCQGTSQGSVKQNAVFSGLR